MSLDRRHLLAGSGALVAGCAARGASAEPTDALDTLLLAQADVLPERAGAGANHYPMAAEALEALDRPELIPVAWRAGAAGYAGPLPRVAPLTDPGAALGARERYGDWLELFRAELARAPWEAVVARWVPHLAPGASAAVFHGLIRTAHAVRALRRHASPARRDELAVALAYWAVSYVELAPDPAGPALRTPLAALRPRWIHEVEDVPFDDVHARLARAPLAPAVEPAALGADAQAELAALVREAAEAFLEMLVQERHRLWLLHTVTGPAAAALLAPELAPPDARLLAAHARQAALALFLAFGAPYEPRAHLRASTPPWPVLTRRAAESGSVHTIKLTEALLRFRHVDDGLCRSVVAQWLEWT